MAHRSCLDCPPLIWATLTSRQKARIEDLLSSTSHPVVVRVELDDISVHLSFPGLWMTIDRDGRTVRTESSFQRSRRLTDSNPAVTPTTSHSSETEVK